jgi:RNA polymerase sigma-70 factor, ECF subfamily
MVQRPADRQPSDEQLARRAQRGCAESFEELMRRFQSPLLQFLRHRGTVADAEDLLQETFLRAYVNLHRYRTQWRFATWGFTIARRGGINHHRPARPMADSPAVDSARSQAPGPPQIVIREDDRQWLWARAAEVLSEEEYTALWLFYVEDMPAREVAALLDRSWVGTKTMMYRARRKLLPFLRDLEPEGLPQCEPKGTVPFSSRRRPKLRFGARSEHENRDSPQPAAGPAGRKGAAIKPALEVPNA